MSQGPVVNMDQLRTWLADLFVLPAKHRLPSPNRAGTQKHARIFHSYFLVLECGGKKPSNAKVSGGGTPSAALPGYAGDNNNNGET